MALQKTISSDFGVDGNYIKIDDVNGDKDNLRIEVSLFANQQARNDGKQSIKHWTFICTTPTGTGNDLFVDLYNHLKNNESVFSGATDI